MTYQISTKVVENMKLFLMLDEENIKTSNCLKKQLLKITII